MNSGIDENAVLYSITVQDVQKNAQEILGRTLAEEELLETKKHLSYGIGESIGIVYSTIFREML